MNHLQKTHFAPRAPEKRHCPLFRLRKLHKPIRGAINRSLLRGKYVGNAVLDNGGCSWSSDITSRRLFDCTMRLLPNGFRAFLRFVFDMNFSVIKRMTVLNLFDFMQFFYSIRSKYYLVDID